MRMRSRHPNASGMRRGRVVARLTLWATLLMSWTLLLALVPALAWLCARPGVRPALTLLGMVATNLTWLLYLRGHTRRGRRIQRMNRRTREDPPWDELTPQQQNYFAMGCLMVPVAIFIALVATCGAVLR